MRRYFIMVMIAVFVIMLLPINVLATDEYEPQTEYDSGYDADVTEPEPEIETTPEPENLPGGENETPEPETVDNDPNDNETLEEPIDDDIQETGSEIIGDSEVIEPEPVNDEIINVVLPMNVNFIIDPFEIMENGQIHSVPHLFENRSEHDIIITFSDITVTFANDIDFLPMPEPFDDTFQTPLKAVFMALGFSSLGEGAFFPVTSPEAQGISIPIVLQAHGATSTICADENCESGVCTDETHERLIIRHYQTALNIMGNVNSFPEVSWASGDIRISLNYDIVVMQN